MKTVTPRRLPNFPGLNGDDADGALLGPIDHVPITTTGPDGQLSSSNYTDTLELAGIVDPDKRNERIARGVVTMEQFSKAVRETGGEFYATLISDIESAIEEFRQMCLILEDRCGKDDDGYSLAPPSSGIERQLVEILDRVKIIAKPFRSNDDNDDVSVPTTAELATEATDAPAPVNLVANAVRNREEAFQALLRVADFFRNTEPHSPVSYALEQAVRWGRMSLPELMKELIEDGSVREDLFRRTGLTVEDDSSSE